MTEDNIKRLDQLREERRDLKFFLLGNGDFRIVKNEFILFKHFGCGSHELSVVGKETKSRIINILEERLEEITKTIDEM